MRPTGKILNEITNQDTRKTTKVIEASSVYAVLYDNKICNVKVENPIYSPRYTQTVYMNEGSANMQANKLNKRFNIDAFSVKELDIS